MVRRRCCELITSSLIGNDASAENMVEPKITGSYFEHGPTTTVPVTPMKLPPGTLSTDWVNEVRWVRFHGKERQDGSQSYEKLQSRHANVKYSQQGPPWRSQPGLSCNSTCRTRHHIVGGPLLQLSSNRYTLSTIQDTLRRPD